MTEQAQKSKEKLKETRETSHVLEISYFSAFYARNEAFVFFIRKCGREINLNFKS